MKIDTPDLNKKADTDSTVRQILTHLTTIYAHNKNTQHESISFIYRNKPNTHRRK